MQVLIPDFQYGPTYHVVYGMIGYTPQVELLQYVENSRKIESDGTRDGASDQTVVFKNCCCVYRTCCVVSNAQSNTNSTSSRNGEIYNNNNNNIYTVNL